MEHKLSDFIERNELLNKLHVGGSNIDMLVGKGMPHILINNIEMYHEPTICRWLMKKQTQVIQESVKIEVKK